MTKQRWKATLNSFGNHIDPQKEEQVKWMKIGKQPETFQFHRRIWDGALRPHRMHFKACLLAQCFPERGYLWHTEWQLIRKIEDQVKKILNIMKNINHGNKERNLRKKSEAIQLIEDFQKHYESLHSFYVDLREEVKKNVSHGDENSTSTSESDSESHHSTTESKARKKDATSDASKPSDSDNQESESSDSEDTILKDKLTCSSEVKKTMNPEPELAFSKSPETGEAFKDLGIQGEESENTSQMLAQIQDLEAQVATLKTEVSAVCTEKRQLEELLLCKSDEAMQMKEKVSRLEAQILEMEATSKQKGSELDSLRKQFVDNEQHYSSRISDLVSQANDMQLELNTLKHQKGDLEEPWSSQVKGLTEQVNSLQHEVVTVNSQKDELKLDLEKKSQETSQCLLQIEILRNKSTLSEQRIVQEKKSLKVKVNDLELEIKSLSSKKSELEKQVKKINDEAFQSYLEKEKLHGRISELQTALSESEKELSIEQMKLKDCQTINSVKIKSLAEGIEHLKNKLEALQNEREHLQVELEDLQNDKKLLQMELAKEKENSSQLEKICRTNFQLMEKKVGEMGEGFRKQYDDKLRILSRRIRVAEQLQNENKEWYRLTRETYEQETKERKPSTERAAIELKDAKDLTVTANELLASLDSQALKFEKSAANLVNRISKVSCELKFAKQWAIRKNKALLQLKDDLDCRLAQLDDKEAEILAFREKVWKSENKVRELEKMVKERDDGVLALNEEKREAIRQLCVWIDYHRGRTDFYKKKLSQLNTGRKRAS